MQFRLWMLMAATAAISVNLALIFAVPPVVAWPILGFVLVLSPAVWISGIVYGTGPWRAFFIGGTAAGLLPFIVATSVVTITLFDHLYFSPPTIYSPYVPPVNYSAPLAPPAPLEAPAALAIPSSQGGFLNVDSIPDAADAPSPIEAYPTPIRTPPWQTLFQTSEPWQGVAASCLLACSGVFAFGGGFLACLVYWTFQPAKNSIAKPAAEVEDDYIVIEGRLKSSSLKPRA